MNPSATIRFSRLAGVGGGLYLMIISSLQAAFYTNTVFSFGYNPVNPIIGVGDTITWKDISGTHTVTGEATNSPVEPFCGGGSLSSGTSCAHTFPNAGRFGYYCVIHGDAFMSGVVTVTNAANTPPSVSLTSISTSPTRLPGITTSPRAPLIIKARPPPRQW